MQRGSLLNVLEERGAGRIETWPAWVRQMVLSQSPLKVGDRFATTLFLLGNGVLPRAIAAYLAGSGLLSDPSAHAHVWCVMRDFRDGALRSDAQYYCMRLQCNVRVHDRDSLWCGGVPADMRDAMYWEDARQILLCYNDPVHSSTDP